MSTNAIIFFQSDETSISYSSGVYQHWDGYPSGVQATINKTIESGLAWELPRFEADEFAAAFIAANKTAEGNYRHIDKSDMRIRYFDFIYFVKHDDELGITVTVGHNTGADEFDKYTWQCNWTGTLDDLHKAYSSEAA